MFLRFMIVRWKKRSMIWVSISLIAFTLLAQAAQGRVSEPYQTSQPRAKALVLYESRIRFGESFPLVDALNEFLGHFNIQVKELERSQWKNDRLKDYDYVFYIGNKTAGLPNNLLLEMSQASMLFWFEQNIEQLSDQKAWQNFISYGAKDRFVALNYRGRNLSIRPSTEFNCAYPADADILVTADDLNSQVPFAWKKDNVVYISRLDFQTPINLILAGILQEMINGKQVDNRQVLLRIEDVQPLTSPDTLSELINTLAKARVPFAVSLTPITNIYGKDVSLVDYPNLLEVLKTVELNGGCFILKGHKTSTEKELEYWDASNDRPLKENEEKTALANISYGIELLAGLGLYPVAFEVPGSSMSFKGYETLAQHFTTLSGRVQLKDLSASLTLDAPFTFRSKRSGMYVYPENLGYFDPKLFDPVGAILDKASDLAVVPVCTGGLFFHSYFEAKDLLPIIKGLRDLDFKFADLRTIDYKVTTSRITIIGKDGYRHVTGDIPTISVDKSLRGMRLSLRNWFYILTAIIAFIILSFLFIISRLRQSKNVMYEQRRR